MARVKGKTVCRKSTRDMQYKHRKTTFAGKAHRKLRPTNDGRSDDKDNEVKSGRGLLNDWSEERMLGAIEEFRQIGSGLRRIARAWKESGMTADAPQSLYDICKAPTRERLALKFVRRKPPSSNLTSDAHFTFLSEKKLKTTAPVARLSRVKQADKAEKTKNKTGERKNCLRSSKDNKETKRRNKNKVGWFCCLCQEDRQADMIQCLGCSRWMHDECLGVDKKDKGTYPCQECMS
jgi:hypothetical protein